MVSRAVGTRTARPVCWGGVLVAAGTERRHSNLHRFKSRLTIGLVQDPPGARGIGRKVVSVVGVTGQEEFHVLILGSHAPSGGEAEEYEGHAR